ncbi:MAG: ribosome biogenesis GTPase Der [Clostridiales bacterium]|nr:ribosome biogenesis GTPase Der [Clostridiales bacterium]
MGLPIVAVVGRPNVGKSTLFNKLVGKRVSIVDDTPGVTRDRIYAECEWLEHRFALIDTGGIEPKSNDVIMSNMRIQAQLAIDTSDVIIFVTDITSGPVATDSEVASMLLKSGKPVVLCVNKCDKIGAVAPEFYEFYNLGFEPIAVSAIHGHGTGDLLDEVVKHFPHYEMQEDEAGVISVAVIGKPNVGKSSLINKICGENRAIVSDIAGTTRDATDTIVTNSHGKFNFIDTAGIRRKSKITDAVEKFSIIRARAAVERANVCIIMIDAAEGFTEQDSKVANIALEAGKACIIAVNKWDIIEKDSKTMAQYEKKLSSDFSFMSYAPVVFISAATGQRIERLFELIVRADSLHSMRISTGRLNEILAGAVAKVQPPTDKGKRLKIYYMTQISVRPPQFVFFVNDKKLFHFSYQRYLENQIRRAFDMDSTPIKIVIRERENRK